MGNVGGSSKPEIREQEREQACMARSFVGVGRPTGSAGHEPTIREPI